MPSTLTKERVLGFLQTIKNNYALTQAGILLLAAEDAPEKFEEYYSHISDNPEAQFEYIKYVFNDYELQKHSTNELRKSVLRNCLKETCEMLKAEITNEKEKQILFRASWYRFLRMVRNSLSHDFRFKFKDRDKKMLPVSWSGLTITLEMEGEILPMAGFLTMAKVQELFGEITEYIEENFR